MYVLVRSEVHLGEHELRPSPVRAQGCSNSITPTACPPQSEELYALIGQTCTLEEQKGITPISSACAELLAGHCTHCTFTKLLNSRLSPARCHAHIARPHFPSMVSDG